jgi:hypothetical protein
VRSCKYFSITLALTISRRWLVSGLMVMIALLGTVLGRNLPPNILAVPVRPSREVSYSSLI